MKNRSYYSCLAVFLICSWFGGCASFPDGKLQELETLPAAPETALKAKLNVTLNYYYNGNPMTMNDASGTATSEQVALETFQKSGYLSVVDKEMSDPDLDIKIKFKNQEEGSFLLAFISGFSMLVIPAGATNTLVMDAEVTHLKTGQTQTYHLEDSVSTYIQILLIVIMPFNWPGTVFEDTLENMYNHLMVKIGEDGLLSKAQIMDTGIETASLQLSEKF